jgi:hypothetical protein
VHMDSAPLRRPTPPLRWPELSPALLISRTHVSHPGAGGALGRARRPRRPGSPREHLRNQRLHYQL